MKKLIVKHYIRVGQTNSWIDTNTKEMSRTCGTFTPCLVQPRRKRGFNFFFMIGKLTFCRLKELRLRIKQYLLTLLERKSKL